MSGRDAWGENMNPCVIGSQIYARVNHIRIEIDIARPDDSSGPLIDRDTLEHSQVA